MTSANEVRPFTRKCARGELDRIGNATHCWRLSRHESDRAFAWRLAIHIQEQIIDREQLLDIVLSLGRIYHDCNDGD